MRRRVGLITGVAEVGQSQAYGDRLRGLSDSPSSEGREVDLFNAY